MQVLVLIVFSKVQLVYTSVKKCHHFSISSPLLDRILFFDKVENSNFAIQMRRKGEKCFFKVTIYIAGLVLVMDIIFCHKIFTNG